MTTTKKNKKSSKGKTLTLPAQKKSTSIKKNKQKSQTVENNQESTLLISANIFGFHFKKHTYLFIHEDKLFAKSEGVTTEIKLDYFHKTKEDFITEVKKINDDYTTDIYGERQYNENEIRRPSPYVINFENPTKEPLSCVILGNNLNLLTPNFGSDKSLIIKPSHEDVTYLELLQQSYIQPFETRIVKIYSNNINQLKQDVQILSKDPNGCVQRINIPAVLYMTNDIKRILPISFPIHIDGNTYLKFTVLPKTKGTIILYPKEKQTPSRVVFGESYNSIHDVYNALISCQIQQGLNYVSSSNIVKFLKDANNLRDLQCLIDCGSVKIIEEDGETKYGFNFSLLNVEGKTNVDLLTALKKSEYNLTEIK